MHSCSQKKKLLFKLMRYLWNFYKTDIQISQMWVMYLVVPTYIVYSEIRLYNSFDVAIGLLELCKSSS